MSARGVPVGDVGPCAVAVVVDSPYLDFVDGAGGQAAERRGGGGARVGDAGPGLRSLLAHLHVVVVDGRTGVGRCRPAHRQPLTQRGDGGLRHFARRLVDVVDVDRHGDGVVDGGGRLGVALGILAVGHLRGDRVAGGGLVVERHARCHPDHSVGVDGEGALRCGVQRVGQRVAVLVGGGHRSHHRVVRVVLVDGAGGVVSGVEGRRGELGRVVLRRLRERSNRITPRGIRELVGAAPRRSRVGHRDALAEAGLACSGSRSPTGR